MTSAVALDTAPEAAFGHLSESAHSAWLGLDSRIPRSSKIIPRRFRDHGYCPATACTVQGMARVRSGQAPAWPLVSDRSVRRGSGVKRDFACTLTRHFPPVFVVLRSQSCLRLEGRARTAQRAIPGSEPSQNSCTFRCTWGRGPGGHRQTGVRVSPARVPSKEWRVPRRQQGGRKRGAAEPIDAGAGAAAPGCSITSLEDR